MRQTLNVESTKLHFNCMLWTHRGSVPVPSSLAYMAAAKIVVPCHCPLMRAWSTRVCGLHSTFPQHAWRLGAAGATNHNKVAGFTLMLCPCNPEAAKIHGHCTWMQFAHRSMAIETHDCQSQEKLMDRQVQARALAAARLCAEDAMRRAGRLAAVLPGGLAHAPWSS